MIHFKNLKSGFSFIEIMVALTLLSIFGSSIFLVQSNIFSKVFKTHQSLFFNQDIIYEMVQLKNKIDQAVINKQPVDAVTIQEHKKNPDRNINLKLIKISPESEHKDFIKNIRLIESTATYDNKQTIKWFNFIYIPELVPEKTKEKPKTTQEKME